MGIVHIRGITDQGSHTAIIGSKGAFLVSQTKISGHHPRMGQWPERLWFVVFVLLVAGDPAQVSAVFFHLIRESLLRATELSGDGAVGDTLRMILPKLNDGIGLRAELTQSCKELLQQHTVGDDLIHRLTAIRDIVAEGTVAIRERLVQRSDVTCPVIFVADTVADVFPNEAVRAHTPAVLLLLVLDAVGFLIKGILLLLGDRYLLPSAANVDKVSFLIFIVLHDKTSDFRVVPEPEAS